MTKKTGTSTLAPRLNIMVHNGYNWYSIAVVGKKRKKNIEKQTGYKFVDEALSNDDLKKIKKQIRKEVSDILFDIWIKRNSWGGK